MIMNFINALAFLLEDGIILLVSICEPGTEVRRLKIKRKISYKKLWLMLVEKEISPASLRKDLNIATGTMTKLRRNEEVALSVLIRICEYLDCNIGDICDAVRVESDQDFE